MEGEGGGAGEGVNPSMTYLIQSYFPFNSFLIYAYEFREEFI
jgi:hypothetical protein